MLTLREFKSKIENLESLGISVSTWAPGDGITRYRFHTSKGEDYFSAPHPLYTALGRKEALVYARGILSGINHVRSKKG